ncbi:MAG: outer membrane lipoprotein carrier protein LolA [Alphaproteobacteria bacterium]|nr:outer membrane lipoprotein carrier protein LolA [Alphaproteobacteria bacterium]
MKKMCLAFILMIFSAPMAYAEDAQTQTIKKIEQYLNQIKTLQADFVQSASNGAVAEGKIYIQKPNKLNMQYGGDAQIAIIGDGKYIIYQDKELDQVTHISYDDIPAALILGNDIKIDGKKIVASGFYQDTGITSVTFSYPENKSISPITLVFNNKPLELKQWKVVDPQGIEVTVSLYNIKDDVKLDSKLFRFKNKGFDPLAN